jgi:hypothetical protein
MELRKQQVADCVNLWETTIVPGGKISWEPPHGPATPSLLSRFLLESVNARLAHHNLTQLEVDDLEDSSLLLIEITTRRVLLHYSCLFTMVDEEDRLAVSEGREGSEFPYIIDNERFTSDGLVYDCNFYPVLTGDENDPLPGFYQLDVRQTVNIQTERGRNYLVEWFLRTHFLIRVGEFLPASEATHFYRAVEGIANFAIRGMSTPRPRVRARVCTICGKQTQLLCGSCDASYCGIGCQKKDWLAGHTQKCK